jgi:hypothetical protein
MGYTGPDAFAGYAPTMRRSLGSFTAVTDQRYLQVEPKTLDVVTLPRSMTLARFAEAYPSNAELSELAILNGVDPDTVLEKGTLVKRVAGGELPND